MRELMWTEENEAHIGEHEVLPAEVEEVVNTRPRYTRRGREQTEEVHGQTTAGRHLLVVLAEAMDGRSYVVTARELNDKEKRAFRERAR